PSTTDLVWSLTSDTTRTAPASADFASTCSTPPPPTQLSVFVTCIKDNGTTFDAKFGYTNSTGDTVNIPTGPANSVTVRGPGSGGQTTSFAPGTTIDAFTVSGALAGSDVEWSVTYAGVTS